MQGIAEKEVGELNYQGLKKAGWSIFTPMAAECLTYAGDGNVSNKKTRFLVVLTSDKNREEALILATAATAEQFATRLQNIEIDLNVKYRFVSVRREVSDKQTLDSFLQDAKELKSKGGKAANDSGVDTTAIAKFKGVVSDAIERGASDIHWWVEPNSSRIALRIDGDMAYEKGYNKLESREMISAVLQEYAPGFRGYESDSRQIDLPIDIIVDVADPVNGGTNKERVRLRLNRNGSKDREGYKATLRIQRTDRRHSDLSTLNYEPWMEEKLACMLNEPYGIFIATGKVGSGKSTTIKAMIELLPETKSGISIEDPIEFEYDHPNMTPVQVDSTDPRSTLEALLHSSLRQDPDFINVSEIRTPEVADDVLGHARVGCVMSSTLHTNDAITSFDRLCELGVSPKELSNTDLFLGFLSQRLMKNLCPHCSTEKQAMGRTVYVKNPEGCSKCEGGYLPGRIAVAELLIPEEDDSPYIEKKDWVLWRKYLLEKGFKTMAIRALELTEHRRICYEDAWNGIPAFKRVGAHVELFNSK